MEGDLVEASCLGAHSFPLLPQLGNIHPSYVDADVLPSGERLSFSKSSIYCLFSFFLSFNKMEIQVLKFNLTESGLFCVLPWLTMALSANLGGWIADSLVTRGLSVTTVRKVRIFSSELTVDFHREFTRSALFDLFCTFSGLIIWIIASFSIPIILICKYLEIRSLCSI